MNRFAALQGSVTVQAEFVPIDAMIHPDAEIAMAFWRHRPADGIRIGRDVPSRAIARLLSRTVVCEPVAGGEDFRVHLAGETINQRFCYDITGRAISEIFDDPSELKMCLDGMKAALESGEPRMMRIIHHSGRVELLRCEVVVLPVSAPNGSDCRALVFAFYF